MLHLIALAGIVSAQQSTPPSLAEQFRTPPNWARPHTWWHWMDGNITAEGIKADLESMAQAGIGGAQIFDVGQGVPSGPVDYNSQEWRDLMVYALREAKKLGLEMTMHNCEGWSSSGGPWVQPEDAMKKITFSSAKVEGPGSARIPIPPSVGSYYRDIAAYAFPATDAPASKGRNELTGLGANPGPVKDLDWPTFDPKAMLPVQLDSEGNATVPAGEWTVLRIGYTLTGAQNVATRASGIGLEVDKLSAESLDRFFAGCLDPLLDQLGKGSALTTVLVDSYETGYNNWTPKMLDEFKKRRGYSAEPYLPALAGFQVGDSRKTLAFLFDYRRTISELWAQNYSGRFASKLKVRGLQLAVEPYGNGNFDPFTYAHPAGLIMGEYWVGEDPINPSVKHSSSIAHIFDHSVVGAEALTASPGQAGWRNQPRQWKPFADHAMTLGINRVIYHRFAHQPWLTTVLPGMTMGPWGSHVDRGNTIWPYMPAWDRYLSRCQMMLQTGHFVADILQFSGEDAPQSYAGEGQDLLPVPSGYDFDFCGLAPLLSLNVRNGRLQLPNGASYSVLTLPNTDRMSLALARKVKALVAKGAVVIGPRPATTPSLAEMAAGGDSEIRKIATEVWGPDGSKTGSHRFGKGMVVYGKSLSQVLSGLAIPPDFTSSERRVHAIHRRAANTDFYFVASSQEYPQTVQCRFRTGLQNPQIQLWHPENGVIETAPIWKKVAGGVKVPLALDDNGSVFVVIGKGGSTADHLTSIQASPLIEKTQPKPRLRILKAVYGDQASGKVADVTERVAKSAGPHSMRISASNAALGGDPAVNIVKTLEVTYEFGGETKTTSVTENGTLAVGDFPDAGTPPIFQADTTQLKVWENADIVVSWSKGKPQKHQVRDVPVPMVVTGPWTLAFPPGWDAPEKVQYDKLASWTDSDEFGIKYFSGTAKYQNELVVPRERLAKGLRLVLDLGDVRELCRVSINGKPTATLWKPPFRMDVTNLVHAGKNDLIVEVTNLWTNRLIGDEQFPDDMGWNGVQLKGWPEWFLRHETRPETRRKTFTTWRHNFKDTPLLPSGLIGPVMLRSVRVLNLGVRTNR